MTTKENSLKSIRARIKKVGALFDKPKALVQEIAVDIVRHAKEHNDCSEALNLVLAVPTQMRRSLILWFMAVSPIGVLIRETGDNKVRFLKEDSPAYNKFDLDKAKAMNWWDTDAEQTQREIQQIYAGGVFEEIEKVLTRVIEGRSQAKQYTDEAKEAATMLMDTLSKFRATFKSKAPVNDDGKPIASETVKTEQKERAAA